MGRSTDAILAYGIPLIDPDGQWLVAEADDDYGQITADWLAESETDPVEAATNRLLAELAGFTETDWQVEGYFARKRHAEERVGLKFVMHCSDECTGWVLATYDIDVSRGYLQSVDLTALAAEPAARGWDARIAEGMRALGLTPQAQPSWLLFSWWG